MTSSTSTRRRFSLPRPLTIGLIVVGLSVAVVVACQLRPKPPQAPYRTVAVERGALTQAVAASGTLQALITVDVGSQISGQISDVKVDFNDQVRKGQVMAVIDPQTYQSRVAQEKADVAAAEAAERQAQAQAANARADFGRKKELVGKGVYSPSVLDLAQATTLAADAAVAASHARVGQVRALLNSNQVDLTRTVIVAPIDGVVVDRKINPGQTVAASFTAPVLFTLAQDLSKLQVKISVDEADVGQVREGQAVRFSVDAFPDDTFMGTVTQVRKQPTTEQNVVAYTVIAVADNPGKKLLPGMTANADIVIDVHPNVLKVPAAALRWKPPPTGAKAQGPVMFGPPPGMGTRQVTQNQPKGAQRMGAVYVLKVGKPALVPVRLGVTDGTNTEISGGLKPGDLVITGGGPKAKPQLGGAPQGGGNRGGGAQVRIGN
jgi:HlyD family secretion protein